MSISPTCTYVYHKDTVPAEPGKRCQNPWNYSYRPP